MTTPAHASEADGRDMSHATFLPPDLGSFCRLDELGLQVVGQRLEPGRAVLAWRVVEPTSSPGGVPLRMPGCAARQRDPAAGARTAGVAPDDVADHDPPLSLHRLWACVAPGHQPGRRAAGEAVASRAAMGARRHRVSALDRRSGRRGPRRVVEHRERRGAGRGQACVDRGPTPVRRCARDRRRRALLAPHPPRR